MEQKEMKEVMFQFRMKYPRHRGVDIQTMKQILSGEKVIVEKTGSKFVVMTKEEVAPGGLLDKMNAITREHNRKVRQINKLNRARAIGQKREDLK